MGNESFDGKTLSEKLSKLNNSQQSIESLSRWCISHRKKAKQIVETWEKLFNSGQKEQRISFLYLSNDILQNSRRKGSEFVSEFWKVLPSALKQVHDTGEESGKKVVTRLVDIWEGRKVFGSRGKSLKDEMLASNPPSRSVSQVKSSNPIKIVKKDAQSVRIKLAVGALPEKIIGAYESVLDEHLNEEAALDKCDIALQCLGKIEEDVEKSKIQGIHLESGLQEELQEQEEVLGRCIEKLDSAEAKRISLVSLLKEALQEHESKLVHISSQLQTARQQVEQARNIRTGLASPLQVPSPTTQTLLAHQQQQVQQAISFAPPKSTEEESKKATAAAVAARLAASASSAQMLTSVLSSLVAEEAASSMNSAAGAPKRPKLENPMMSESGGAPGFFAPTPPLPPPPPPPISQSGQTPASQYVQQQQGHFGYMPMPMPPHFGIGMTRPNNSSSQAQAQQAPNGGPFYRPPGMGFYGQTHQPTTPPVHRQ